MTHTALVHTNLCSTLTLWLTSREVPLHQCTPLISGLH